MSKNIRGGEDFFQLKKEGEDFFSEKKGGEYYFRLKIGVEDCFQVNFPKIRYPVNFDRSIKHKRNENKRLVQSERGYQGH